MTYSGSLICDIISIIAQRSSSTNMIRFRLLFRVFRRDSSTDSNFSNDSLLVCLSSDYIKTHQSFEGWSVWDILQTLVSIILQWKIIKASSTSMFRFRLSSEDSEGIHLQTQISHVTPFLQDSLLITSRLIKVLKADQHSGTNPWNLGRCRTHDNLPHTRACDDYYYKFDHHRPWIKTVRVRWVSMRN